MKEKLHFLCSAVSVVSSDGTKGKAFLDTGTGRSYISPTIPQIVEMKSFSKATKSIEIKMSSNTKAMNIYDVKIENLHYTLGFDTESHKIEKNFLCYIILKHKKPMKDRTP